MKPTPSSCSRSSVRSAEHQPLVVRRRARSRSVSGRPGSRRRPAPRPGSNVLRPGSTRTPLVVIPERAADARRSRRRPSPSSDRKPSNSICSTRSGVMPGQLARLPARRACRAFRVSSELIRGSIPWTSTECPRNVQIRAARRSRARPRASSLRRSVLPSRWRRSALRVRPEHQHPHDPVLRSRRPWRSRRRTRLIVAGPHVALLGTTQQRQQPDDDQSSPSAGGRSWLHGASSSTASPSSVATSYPKTAQRRPPRLSISRPRQAHALGSRRRASSPRSAKSHVARWRR